MEPSLHPGQKLTRRVLDAMGRGASAAIHLRATDGTIARVDGRGIALTREPTAEEKANALHCKLTTNATAPIRGIVEIYEGADTTSGGAMLLHCRQPANPGWSRVGVLSWAGCVQNDSPWVQIAGPCIIRLDDYAAVSVGDQVGAGQNTYNAVKYPGAAFLVLGLLESPYAICIRSGDRLGTKMVKTGSSTGYPVKVIIFSSAYSLSQTAPGDVTVTVL